MLEKLFTSKARIRILEYLFFHKKETYLREIAKDLALSPSVIKRELDNLLNLGLINKQKNKLSLNESNPFLEDLKRIFLKTDFISYPIKKALKKQDIKFILIFGSFAKGNYTLDSDIDLLVIGNTKQREIFKLLKPIEKLIIREINPIVWTLDELKRYKNKAFIKDIMKKNKIMIKGDESEFQRIIRQQENRGS
ncbi:nucleotidyltransferase domain-containing protein [Candidatus Woesearchaeota archaeon]|nr:nucleotidyltransferase domain-containing protein [Candidatus Woesearchaeota archaeon]